MFNFLSYASSLMPLRIDSALWDGDCLSLASDGWSFKTDSVWRLSKGNNLLLTCWDDGVQEAVMGLIGLAVVDIAWVINEQPIDPSMNLSDGRRLDVFCSSSTDPWIMSLPDGKVYIGNS